MINDLLGEWVRGQYFLKNKKFVEAKYNKVAPP